MNVNYLAWAGVVCLCSVVAAQTASQTALPAEQKIVAAERMVAANPDKADAYNELALAYSRRARETGDPAYYGKADGAIDRALQLAPDNFEALKLRAWVLLGRHEFARALELARRLNKRAPDDVLVYGLLTDAYAELGQYEAAEESCQWMLDLRPGNIPAFTRAAYLRELFGDLEGAIELISAAYQRTAPSEIEDRAWILTQIGHLELTAGRPENADRVLGEALTLVPDYHYALAALAKVRSAEKRYAEAVDLLKRRYDRAPHPENLYELAGALEKAGRASDAKAAYAEFEARALQEADGWDNANRELVLYLAGRGGKPDEALRVARLEIARRQDVYTLDAYAWALHVNGRHDEAVAQIERALAVGVKDPEVLSRAATITKERRPSD
jgi:tetratricopeptide (TPR) repeat protein